MKKKVFNLILLTSCLIGAMTSCKSNDGKTKIDYSPVERDRYDNIFRDNIPNQWENYGIGDPFLLRYNGEYYLYVSTKDNNPGYKCWKSKNLINYEYLGQFKLMNSDGTETGQYGQYAPEVYYWNGDFYMYGSPAGRGHYVYKSVTGLPYGDFKAVTDNLGMSIDGSVFIDDNEEMYFMVAGQGAIKQYPMTSMTDIDSTSGEDLYSPLIRWTEGPCMIKHNDTYFLTYTGNHVKSKGYRIDYSYSTESPAYGFEYPSNNSICLNTIGEQNGMGHSSTVLGPNLDSYYMAYHSLDDASGPIRSFNINRLSFTGNRMTMYGPSRSGAMVPVLPDFVDYDKSKMTTEDNISLSNTKTSDYYSVEYNFKNFRNDGSTKLLFSDNESHSNYISINDKKICLYVENALIGEGELKNDFDFAKLHSIRLNYRDGHYRVFFDNMKKIDVTNKNQVSGGFVGYLGLGIDDIGNTVFSNDAFDSSDREEAKIVEGEFYAANFLEESNLSNKSNIYQIDEDIYDEDCLYTKSSAVKLAKTSDYVLYTIDALEDSLYGIELTHSQDNAGSIISIQIDNNEPILVKIPKNDYSQNMKLFEDKLKYVKNFVAEVELTKGLHTFKVELVKGNVDLVYFNFFKDSKFSPNYEHNLDSYIDSGADYLSLWKIVEDDNQKVHKAKAGVNNMILVGNESMTDYEVSVDIKLSINSANNSMAGIIVRCNNPSLFPDQIDQSAQGYFVGFNRMQLSLQRLNYSTITTSVLTGTYELNEYHNLKVRCKGNRITVFFDNQEAFSFTDSNPYSHGLVCLYSINSESYYKNLSIKGV